MTCNLQTHRANLAESNLKICETRPGFGDVQYAQAKCCQPEPPNAVTCSFVSLEYLFMYMCVVIEIMRKRRSFEQLLRFTRSHSQSLSHHHQHQRHPFSQSRQNLQKGVFSRLPLGEKFGIGGGETRTALQ
jgi:hypothetical protein